MWCQATFKNVKCRDKPNKEPLTLFPSVAFSIVCGFAAANQVKLSKICMYNFL